MKQQDGAEELILIRFMVFKGLLLFTRLGIRRTDIINL